MTAMGSGSPEPVTAFLDANVVWGSLESDLLLTLADRGVIQAFWSERVLAEVSRTVHRRRPGANIEGRLATMRSSFPSAMVRGFEHLEPDMPADAGDRHVLAAAVHCGAAYLVTDNVKHFWPAQADLSIGEVPVDDFCRALLQGPGSRPRRPASGLRRDGARDCRGGLVARGAVYHVSVDPPNPTELQQLWFDPLEVATTVGTPGAGHSRSSRAGSRSTRWKNGNSTAGTS